MNLYREPRREFLITYLSARYRVRVASCPRLSSVLLRTGPPPWQPPIVHAPKKKLKTTMCTQNWELPRRCLIRSKTADRGGHEATRTLYRALEYVMKTHAAARDIKSSHPHPPITKQIATD